MFRAIFVLAALGLAGACVPPSAAGRRAAAPQFRATREYVGLDELRRFSGAGSLLDALHWVRPHMVRPRNTPGLRARAGAIDVFINGSYAGGAEVLRSLTTDAVASVRMVTRAQGYLEHGSQLRGEHALFITLLR